MLTDKKYVIWDFGSQDRAGLIVHQFADALGEHNDVTCFVRKSYIFRSENYSSIRTLFFSEKIVKFKPIVNLIKYIDYYLNILLFALYVFLQKIQYKRVICIINVYQLLLPNYHLIRCVKYFASIHLVIHDVLIHENSLPRIILTTQEKLITNSDSLISFNDRSTKLLQSWKKPIIQLDFPPYNAVYNEVNPDNFDSEQINILFIGHFRKEKNLEWLLDVWSSCSDEEYLNKLKLTVAGSGNLGFRGSLKNAIIINQYITDEQYNKLLSQANFVILPYHGVTNSGVLNDAMAAGLPCIVSNDPLFLDHKYIMKNYMFHDVDSLKNILRAISMMSASDYKNDIQTVDSLRQAYSKAFKRSIASYGSEKN